MTTENEKPPHKERGAIQDERRAEAQKDRICGDIT